MMEAEARARRDGYASMLLTVHPDNARAVTFYEQLGWERHTIGDGDWTGNMEKLTQVTRLRAAVSVPPRAR